VARAAGLTPISRFCGDTALAGHEVFEELVRAHPGVTALVSLNERATVGVMQAAAGRGWRIPGDFSIVAVASSARVAEMTMPPLTALTPPSAELGRLGVETLIEQIEERNQELVQRLLPCRLVDRGSAGPAPDPARRSHLTARSG
jgi:DNA-binding LacI/PurR family transcriptional regulator